MKATIEQAIEILKALSFNEHVEVSVNIKVGKTEKEECNELSMIDGIVSYFNEVCGTNYKSSTASTRKHINARIKEGFSFTDFKTVINFLFNKWSQDQKMKDYLRPETVFGTKFEGYLNRAKTSPKKNSWGDNVF